MKNRIFSLKTLLIFVVIAIALVCSFVYGGNAPGYKHTKKNEAEAPSSVATQNSKKYIQSSVADTNTKAIDERNNDLNKKIEKKHGNIQNIESEEDKKIKEQSEKEITTDIAEEANATEIKDKPIPYSDDNICYISVVCDTILSNLEFFNKDKLDILPDRGVILPETEVEFIQGESVFSVTHKVLKRNKIHFEFTDNPMYSSVYVEGISNIYEFDCGDLSGWMYCVNGEFPNYGCSGYKVKTGDRIEWKYTCNLGEDVGNRFSNQR